MSIYEYIKKTSVEKIKLEIVKETKLIAMEMIAAFKDAVSYTHLTLPTT